MRNPTSSLLQAEVSTGTHLTEALQYDSSTYYSYDPGSRVLSSQGEFSSPNGDFKVTHRTMYVYAPPQSPGPVPGNAVMSSLSESRAGPCIAMNREREETGLPPLPDPSGVDTPSDKPAPTADQLDIPPNPGLPKFKGLDPSDPSVEFSTAMNTFVYP